MLNRLADELKAEINDALNFKMNFQEDSLAVARITFSLATPCFLGGIVVMPIVKIIQGVAQLIFKQNWQEAKRKFIAAPFSIVTLSIMAVRSAVAIIFPMTMIEDRTIVTLEGWKEDLMQAARNAGLDNKSLFSINRRLRLSPDVFPHLELTFAIMQEIATILPELDKARQDLVMQDLADACQHCLPRIYEEVWRIRQTLSEPAGDEEKVPFYLTRFYEQILYEMALQEKDTKYQPHYVNWYKQHLGEALGLDCRYVKFDPVYLNLPTLPSKEEIIENFSAQCTMERLCGEIGYLINRDTHFNLRAHWLHQLAQTPIDEEDPEQWVIDHFVIPGRDMKINEAGIRAIVEPLHASRVANLT